MKINDPKKVERYWQRAMRSFMHNMNRGAQYISRVMTCAHRDGWRRKDKVQRGHEQHTKHHHHDRK